MIRFGTSLPRIAIHHALILGLSGHSGPEQVVFCCAFGLRLTRSGQSAAKFAVMHNTARTAMMRSVEPGQGNEKASGSTQIRPRQTTKHNSTKRNSSNIAGQRIKSTGCRGWPL
jgi:hypothetical protein